MGIVELGALGEFISSIAVLTTLIYLTFQVREARAESRASLLHHRNDAARGLWLSEASNPELVAAIVKGEQALGSDFPAVTAIAEQAGLRLEEARMVVLNIAANFFHRQSMYLSRLTAAERQTLDHQLVGRFSRGLDRIWFEYIDHNTFDSGFIAHVEELLQDPTQ